MSAHARVVGPTLRRALDVAWYLGVVGTAVAAVVLVVVLVRGGHPHVEMPVDLVVPGRLTVEGGRGAGALVNASGQLSVVPPAAVVWAGLAFAVTGVTFVLVVLHHLRALFAQAAAGSPFGPQSAQRVRLIGAAIVAGELTRAGVVLAASRWAAHHVRGTGVSFHAGFPIRVEILGLGVLVILLGQVFRTGSALQQDHDLTI